MTKILLMAASLGKNSCNKKLINLVASLMRTQPQVEIILLEFADFIAPPYDSESEIKFGLPAMVQAFITQMHHAHGIVVASPEYNFSIPGTLKNLLDWVSRARPMPFTKYPVMLCSASPSLSGGNRGLLHSATIIHSALQAHLFPPMFSLAAAYQAFAADGSLKDKALEQRLSSDLAEFVKFVQLFPEPAGK